MKLNSILLNKVNKVTSSSFINKKNIREEKTY